MFRYNGPAVIVLEGSEVLEFHSNGNGMLYFLGAPESRIRILDLRGASVEAAKLALGGTSFEAFLDIFSSLAWVEVNDNPEKTEITLREYHSEEGTPVTLRLGVRHEQVSSIRRSFWGQTRFLASNQVAFAALMDD